MTGEAVIYARISDDKAGTAAGVARQLDECREFADRLGLTVTREYVDNDLSATSGKRRPAFEDLLGAKPPAIIAWAQDRLLRLSTDLERVIALDVPIYTVTAGTLDLATPAGRAVARTVAAWSQYEGEQKAERQRASSRQRRAAGLPHLGNRRFGWELDRVTIREDEAEWVRRATQHVLDGGSLYAFAKRLNDAGVTTSRGNKWGVQSLRQVLRRPANAGFLDDAETPSAIEPIVSVADWRAVVELLANPARNPNPGPKVHTLLGGIATCSTCGGVMRSASNKQRGKTIPLYRCDSGCSIIRRSVADDSVLLQLVVVLGEGFPWPDLAGDTARLGTIRAELAENARLAAVQQELAEMPGANMAKVRARLAELDADRQRLTAELDAATDAAELAFLDLGRGGMNVHSVRGVQRAQQFVKAFEVADVDAKRTALKRLVQIEVRPGRGVQRVAVTPRESTVT